ncbi:MAG: A24 family peptidase, partial [Phenylobacterium sp.]
MSSYVPSVLLLALFPAAVIVAAFKDATSFTIPNWIPGLMVVLFFPTALIAHLSLPALATCLAVGVVGLLAGMALFALNWCGGGDAKLLATCLLWLGLPAAPTFLLATGVAGGVLALGLISARKGLIGAYAASGPAWLGRLLTPGADLPYGLAIAA